MLVIVAAQSVLCAINALANASWLSSNDFDTYVMEMDPSSHWLRSLIAFFQMFLLLSTFLPISLQVVLEVIKVV